MEMAEEDLQTKSTPALVSVLSPDLLEFSCLWAKGKLKPEEQVISPQEETRAHIYTRKVIPPGEELKQKRRTKVEVWGLNVLSIQGLA